MENVENTEAQKPKKKFLQGLLKIVKPFVRGTIKSLPFGGVAVELVDNIKAELNPEKDKKHNYISILIQLTGLGLIVYAFVTKQITIEQVLDILNSLFGSDAPSEAVSN